MLKQLFAKRKLQKHLKKAMKEHRRRLETIEYALQNRNEVEEKLYALVPDSSVDFVSYEGYIDFLSQSVIEAEVEIHITLLELQEL